MLLLGGLGVAAVLPKSSYVQPCGVSLSLPPSINDWYGEEQVITPRELQVLAGDTEFARKVYSNPFGDKIFVSIVLSGQDLNNSIHRPERCLPAQGWTIADTRSVTIPMPSLNTHTLEVTRLHNTRKVTDDSGRLFSLYNLNYYWFIGAQELSASHFTREYVDMRDRIMKGSNQRWAYVTVAATITENLQKFGRSEAKTDELIQTFIESLFPLIYKPN
jgi:EpsI family protein